MTYKKGDYIRYTSSGVCLIEDVKILDHTKNKQEFYILKPVGIPTSTIYVPTDNEALVEKMRYILKKEEIDELITSLKNTENIWIESRKERTIYFKEILKNCNPQELLRLVSCIYLKRQELESEGKKLSATDETMLTQAETFIANEFSFVLNLSSTQVGEYIREKLEI